MVFIQVSVYFLIEFLLIFRFGHCTRNTGFASVFSHFLFLHRAVPVEQGILRFSLQHFTVCSVPRIKPPLMLLMERAALIVFLRMTFYFLFDIWIDTVRHAAHSFSCVIFFIIIFFWMLPAVKTEAGIITFSET